MVLRTSADTFRADDDPTFLSEGAILSVFGDLQLRLGWV